MSQPSNQRQQLPVTAGPRPPAGAPIQANSIIVTQSNVLADALGPVPIVRGEDVEVYKQFYLQIRTAIAPKNPIEELYCDRIIDLQWDSMRFRRCKVALIDSLAHIGVRAALKPFMDVEARNALIKKWINGDEQAVSEVKSHLGRLGPVEDVISAHTMLEMFEKLECFDRVIAQLEARLDDALRELERRRASLARQLRQAFEDVEDAEYEEVPASEIEAVAGEAAA